MDSLVLFSKAKLERLISKRNLELKFGEQVKLLPPTKNIYEDLKHLDVNYVILGLPEAVGVFANHGKLGTYNTYEATIKMLLNTQINTFNQANKTLMLGHLDFSVENELLSHWKQSNPKHINKARKLVEEIDKTVSDAVYSIVKAGKTPILIGGGHNNAYGNIKGTSLAYNKKINAVNFDAHADYRALEGRHSGNGFSYAFAEGFLGNYFAFGLHENYNASSVFDTLKNEKHINFNTYEAFAVRKELKFKNELQRALACIEKKPFGIEIDCDAIENIASSAQTPSGFSVEKTRQFLHYFASHKNAAYLHICEAAPKKKQYNQVGKLLSYLITDFIKANSKNNNL